MKQIRLLTDKNINQIAAGEVIENPASVVKELVENSLDSGASEIIIEVQGGGRQLIRVVDNGAGMIRDDAILSIERHATSKIRGHEDLSEAMTMGFRGEALAAISSVSKFSLLTNTGESDEGTLLTMDGGRIVDIAAAPREKGTTVEVRSLFFNVPVRRKFLRSVSHDAAEIKKVVSSLAMANPSIRFRLLHNGRVEWHLAASEESSSKRVEDILGKDFVDSCHEVHVEEGPITVHGLISQPFAHKPNRTGQHLFINRRPVVSSLISSMMSEAYGMRLPPKRYPLFVLHFTLPCEYIDVNVHPQKREVRLRQETVLRSIVNQLVNKGLQPKVSVQPLFASSPIEHSLPWESKKEAPPAPIVTSPAATLVAKEQKQEVLLPLVKQPRILAVLQDYLLVEALSLPETLFPGEEEGVIFVDIVAARARIIFDHICANNALDSSLMQTEPLLVPFVLDLSSDDFTVLVENIDLLNAKGISVRPLSGHTLLVDAVPKLLREGELSGFLEEFAVELRKASSRDIMKGLKEKALARVASRRARIVENRLSMEEAKILLQQLLNSKEALHTPFGQSTMMCMRNDEIKKLFL